MSPMPSPVRKLRWRIEVLFCRHKAEMVWDDGDPFHVCERCGVEMASPEESSDA